MIAFRFSLILLAFVSAPLWAANSISWGTISLPTTGSAGQTITFSASVTNTGSAWGSNHYLEVKDAAGVPQYYASLAGTAANATVTPSFVLTLPATTGSKTYTFTALEYGVEFFGPTEAPTASISVSSALNQPPTAGLSASTYLLSSPGSFTLSATGVDADGFVVSLTIEAQYPNRTSWQTLWSGAGSHTYTEYVVPGVTRYRVRCVDNQGAPSSYAYASVSGLIVGGSGPPLPPTWVNLNNVAANSAGVSWSPVSGVSSYTVRAVSAANTVVTVTYSATNATLTGLTPNSSYTVSVQSANGTEWSSPVLITTPLAPPIAEYAVVPETGAVPLTVAFDASFSSAINGTLAGYAWDFDNNGSTDATGVTASHTFNSTGTYLVKLTATDSGNRSASITRPVYVTNGTTRVLDDSGFIHGAYEDEEGNYNSATTVTFGFTVSYPGGAVVDMPGTDGGLFSTNIVDGNSQNPGSILLPGNYWITVSGANETVGGYFSITVDIVPRDIVRPSAPTNLAVSNVQATSAALNWTAATDNVALGAYELRVNGQVTGSISSSATSATLTSLTPGTSYAVALRANDSSGNQSLSSATATFATPIAKPTALSASHVTTTAVELVWTAPAGGGATGYKIFDTTTTTTLVRTISAVRTTATVTMLSPGTQHTFTVKAFNGSSVESDASDSVTVTTSSLIDGDSDNVPNRIESILGTQTGTANSTDTSNALEVKIHRP
ncbi:MAG: fibronectin type III domain-containing protein [Verrucomicrobia bacterium]|nr:fibronectin type III domain-containing protein [Verrucomicrobiota bacterium]